MEAGGGVAASAGSDDGVAVGREGGEQGAGSGQYLEAGDVGDFGLLDEFGLMGRVEVGRDQADGLDGGASVSDVDDVGGVEVVLVGPGGTAESQRSPGGSCANVHAIGTVLERPLRSSRNPQILR